MIGSSIARNRSFVTVRHNGAVWIRKCIAGRGFPWYNPHEGEKQRDDLIALIMFGFFLKKDRFFGIDFGTSSIKAVEITMRNQKPYVTNYAWVTLDFMNATREHKSISYPEQLKIYFDALLAAMKSDARNAYAAVPGYSGLVTLIEFPVMNEEEIAQALQFEARKYIPSSLDEVNMSWEIVSPSEKKGKKEKTTAGETMMVVLVAAPKKDVARYDFFFHDTGLTMKTLELETFSLIRSLVGEDQGRFIIVDIGAKACAIILVSNGVVHVNRNIDTGGSDITKTIAESMNISWERADSLKKEGRDFFVSRETSMIFPTLDLIANEIKRIVAAFREKEKGATIDSVILSGGTAKLKGIDQYLAKIVGIPVVVGDPWKRVVCDERLSRIVNQLGASFAVAIGLALRGMEERNKK